MNNEVKFVYNVMLHYDGEKDDNVREHIDLHIAAKDIEEAIQKVRNIEVPGYRISMVMELGELKD